MKKIIYSLFLLFTATFGFSQATFWTEDFGNGCNKGQVASTFSTSGVSWTETQTGTNATYSNGWFVSATEAGTGVGNCGDGCISNSTLTNRTLHISSNFLTLVDIGAAYASGAAFDTDRRIETPNINFTGKSNVKLEFNYFSLGVGGQDFYAIYYSANGGSTWSLLSTPPATTLGSCAPQGKWNTYSVSMPAAVNNQAQVKLGFRWQNNNSSGADPGVSIDDIKLSTNTTFTPSFAMTGPLCPGGSITVTANTGTTVATGYTWTAAPLGYSFSAPNASVTNITFTGANTYTITLSVSSGTNFGLVSNTIVVNTVPNAVNFTASSMTICAGQGVTLTATGAPSYTWLPGNANANPIVYTPGSTTTYSCTGWNGPCKGNTAVKQVTVVTCTGLQEIAAYNNLFSVYPNPNNGEFSLDVNTASETISYAIYNSLGQLLGKEKITGNRTPINIKSYPQGIYHITILKDNRVIYKTKVVKN